MNPFLLQYLICFLIFVFLQAMFINGVKSCFEDGMIFSRLKPFIDKIVGDYFNKMIYKCIKCMSSAYGALTFWFFVTMFFGFHWEEIPIFISDLFILVTFNWYIYKKL